MSYLFRIPLHVSGTLPKKIGKPHGKFGCEKLAFGQDIARTLPRDAGHPRAFRYGFSEYGNCCLAKYRSRARRTTIGITAHDGLQAISFEFRGINIAIEEFESDALWAAHMDRAAFRLAAAKRLKPAALNVRNIQRARAIETSSSQRMRCRSLESIPDLPGSGAVRRAAAGSFRSCAVTSLSSFSRN